MRGLPHRAPGGATPGAIRVAVLGAGEVPPSAADAVLASGRPARRPRRAATLSSRATIPGGGALVGGRDVTRHRRMRERGAGRGGGDSARQSRRPGGARRGHPGLSRRDPGGRARLHDGARRRDRGRGLGARGNRPRERRTARRRCGGDGQRQERTAHQLGDIHLRRSLHPRGRLPAGRLQGRHGVRCAGATPARDRGDHGSRRGGIAARGGEPAGRTPLARGANWHGSAPATSSTSARGCRDW